MLEPGEVPAGSVGTHSIQSTLREASAVCRDASTEEIDADLLSRRRLRICCRCPTPDAETHRHVILNSHVTHGLHVRIIGATPSDRVDSKVLEDTEGLSFQRRVQRKYLRSIDITKQKDVNIEMFWTVYFDDMELAREWLNELLSVEPDYVIVDPIWLQFESLAPLRKLDEFRQLQQLYRHDDFWREHGWPAYCRPAGPVDFTCGNE